MTALDIFTYSGQQVRTVVIDGEPWFVASDVAYILGYRMASDLTRSLDDDEKGTHETRTPSGDQLVSVITEAGLFKALVQRQTGRMVDEPLKAFVKAFQRFVTHEVLPAIRKTGSYSNTPALTEDQIVQQALTILVAKTATLEAKVTELEPIAAESMTYRQSAGLRTIQDLANDLRTHALAALPGVHIIQSDVYEHAGRLGLIIRGNTVRNNQPTAQAINAGWVKPARTPIERTNGSQETKVYTRLTPKGGARLWDGCLNYIAEHGSLTIQKAVA